MNKEDSLEIKRRIDALKNDPDFVEKLKAKAIELMHQRYPQAKHSERTHIT